MKHIYKRKLKFTLVFSALIVLSIAKAYAQPASLPPFVKYAVNNFSSIAKAACDTCVPEISAPLQQFRPIPFPEAGPIQLATGVDVSFMPGLMVPNFWGGGSPEIKGYMAKVAGINEERDGKTRLGELLYFKGAKGVAISKESGTIYTSAPTLTLGAKPIDTSGFFTFKSTPAIMPKFNDLSDKKFEGSPNDYKVFVRGGQDPDVYNNKMTETIYFTIDPNDEKIMYASMRNPSDTAEKGLFRKNGEDGWYLLDTADAPVWGALAVDNSGNLYIADPNKNIIVKATFDNFGNVSSWVTIAGTDGTAGFKNDRGVNALFQQPSGICIDNNGNIYIGDAGNNRVRKIDDDGDVTTYAGTGAAGFVDDNSASDAKFNGPTAVAYNESTKSLFVVDYNNNLIREIDKDRKVTTLAGNPGKWLTLDPTRIAMQFYYILAKMNLKPDEQKLDRPTGLAIDPSGHGLYVSDHSYIWYVSTFPAKFVRTSAFRELDSTQLPVPILPLGLEFDEDNGAFYGIPLMPWPPTTYTISVLNSRGESIGLANGFITIEVAACPEKTDSVFLNKTISLSQLPHTWYGKRFDSAATIAVTSRTRLGCDSVTILNLSIYPELTYNSEPYVLGFGQPIKPILPTTRGSIIETFSVAPALPAGLVLNTGTGEITGTPSVYVPGNPVPAIGPQTPPPYAAPWYLEADKGVDLTEVKISDGNGKVLLENNSKYGMLEGTAGMGTGRAGAYTDYSALAPTKMYSNSPYSIRLANVLASPDRYLLGPHGLYEYNPASRTLNESFNGYNFMNSFAVYIDYNRDGDFEEANERVYISAGPQWDAHAEVFNLNIPASAKAGVTKMRIYAVEAKTIPWTFTFYDPSRGLVNQTYYVERTTEQALSFYPFFDSISNFNNSGPGDFYFHMDYGEFEDYNIEIITPPTQGYVVTGRNAVGSAQSTVRLAVSRASSSTTNLTICQAQLPYKWNNLVLTEAGTKTDTLKNIFAADSLATLNLTVNQPSGPTYETVAQCGPYNFHGQIIETSGNYRADLKNLAGCDSSIYLTFRQKATASVTNLTLLPNALTNFTWNGIPINTAGTYAKKSTNVEGCDSIATLKLRVEYNVYYTNNLLTLGTTIVPISPRIEGGYVPPGVWYNSAYGYSISPNLPGGLSLDPITGVISGTPTALSPFREYIITLGQEGALPSKFSLSVGEPSFSTTTLDNCGPLTWNEVYYDKAGTYVANLKNHFGYDSTATLVLSIRDLSASTTILNLNPAQLSYSWNDTSITKEGLYTVILRNAVGCDSAATADVVISPKMAYVSPQILLQAQTIAHITPQNLGGRVLNYTIAPSLVSGLQFSASTGIISGTPTDTLPQPVTYTITASNRAGNYSTELVVGVCNPIATSFSKDTCDVFVWNDSTYTESTTHTRILKNRGGCDSTVTMNLTVRRSSKGLTEAVTACGSYTWYNVKYEKTGIYPQIFPNAVGCDSTIYLNLTINPITVTELYVNLNASDFPYTWREKKTFSAPGRDSIMSLNEYGCYGPTWMNVRISDVLPDISYAMRDTILNWEQSITPPIVMTNTGTAVPAMKLGQTDTLMKISNSGPGNFMRHTVKGPDGAYYAVPEYSSIIYRLDSSKAWTVFADVGDNVTGMAFDTSGNLYVANGTVTREGITKITPAGNQSPVGASAAYWNVNSVSVDADNNLIMIGKARNTNNLSVSKLNLSTNDVVELQRGSELNDYFRAIKVDSKGNIYVAESNSGRLLKIKPDGRRSTIGSTPLDYNRFQAGNGPDARIPEDITSLAIDPANDNLYLMANGNILRVDTAENVTQITGRQFDAYKDYIVGVESGKVFIINNSTARLFTANVYGVGSFPFMDNYGASGVNNGTVNFTDFDKRIRLDSSGSIVGTPRSTYATPGYRYGSNSSISYTIIAANEHGISKAPMGITTKGITYKRESFITTTLPFTWRGRSFTAATDTATYYVKNRLEVDDTVYILHLVYEGLPEPVITSNCVTGGVSLAANGAAKSAISFDGTKMGIIKNTERNIDGGQVGFYNVEVIKQPDNSELVKFHSSFEVWIKPASVSGTQYLLTRDTVKTHGTFFGYSIQDGKFVYEFTQSGTTDVEYTLSSAPIIKQNEWTHVAASFYDSTMFIFINGKLEGSQKTGDRFTNLSYSEAPGSSVSIWPDFFLGGLPGKNGYKGEMDELRLWGKRRNADSVKATMNTIVDPSSFRLGLYYRFDGDITNGVPDVSLSGRTANFIKPATSVTTSGAPINFASYNWTPGDSTTKSVIAKPTTSTTYKVTVKDYKGTSASASLLVYPAQAPAVTAPAVITKTNSPASCTVVVSDTELGSAIATDNCPDLVINRTGVPAGNAFPVGVTIITYTATSMTGLTTSATQTVTITDVSKPAFTIGLTAPLVVWPPDHRLKPVALTYTTADLCGTVTNKVTVTSTDPITGVSDGDISPDWVITNDHLVQLRAERGNGKEARIYTITVTPVDEYGNVGIAQSTKVTIAHNIKGPITGTSFKIGSTVNFSGVFWDKQGNKHTGEWVIDDNTIVKGIVTEPSGSTNGKITGSYKFTAAGTYKLKMNITDQNRVTSYCNTNEDMEAIVVIYDPAGGYTYGGGWFASPAGALKSDAAATGKANFGYAVSYFKGAANPKGETQFELKVGDFEYNALNFEYLSVAGAKAQIKGTGKIVGGQSGINFIMTVIDGALDRTGIDKVRIKVYNKNTGQVYYDNEQGSDANSPVTKVGTNSQVVIGGTNITSGSTAPVATRAATPVAPTEEIATLQVRAFPNPSQHQFNLIVKGRNNEPVSIRVMDVTGRVVEERKAVPANSTLTLGAFYRPGLYIAEVVQGNEKRLVKLTKE